MPRMKDWVLRRTVQNVGNDILPRLAPRDTNTIRDTGGEKLTPVETRGNNVLFLFARFIWFSEAHKPSIFCYSAYHLMGGAIDNSFDKCRL